MTTRDAGPGGRQTVTEALHLVAMALAAVVIAIVSQGWPASEATCDGANACISEADGEF